MSFPFYIAKRYLFTKTSNNAINIITLIASFGVILGSLALFIILSGFSGLRTFSYGLLEASDPDIKIFPSQGKRFLIEGTLEKKLSENEAVVLWSEVLEERAFLEYQNKNEIAFVKGVDQNYNKTVAIDSAIFIGNWLDFDYRNIAVIGRAIASKLSMNIGGYGDPLQILVPKSGTGFLNPANAFYQTNVQVFGLYTGTEEFESKFIYIPIDQARDFLRIEKREVSAVEVKIHQSFNVDAIAKELQESLGDRFTVRTKEQLNTLFYKVINTENFVSYLIFTLIVVIALFNVIGAIIMMIIDKKDNLKTLINIGANIKEIKRIFIYQGFLLTLVGMGIGLFLGVILVFVQQKFSIFMITENFAYPVEFRWMNLIIVVATITLLGYGAARIASNRINLSFLNK